MTDIAGDRKLWLFTFVSMFFVGNFSVNLVIDFALICCDTSKLWSNIDGSSIILASTMGVTPSESTELYTLLGGLRQLVFLPLSFHWTWSRAWLNSLSWVWNFEWINVDISLRVSFLPCSLCLMLKSILTVFPIPAKFISVSWSFFAPPRCAPRSFKFGGGNGIYTSWSMSSS